MRFHRSRDGWRALLSLATGIVLAIASATPIVSSAADRKLLVYAVNFPLQYFAQRIAGQHADVRFPAPADIDPAFWVPDAETIAQYQYADIILLNGAGYANWVNRATLPRLRLVDTSAGFRDRYIHTADGTTHSHGPGGDHSHADTAFTTWLDLSQAAEQARAIRDSLTRELPEYRDKFERNFALLERELLTMDAQIRDMVAASSRQPLLASHPVYQYFARRYALNLKSVLWEADTLPDKEQWLRFASLHGEHHAKWMIWEAEPNPASVEKLQEMGIESLVVDPGGNRPEQGDFMSVMTKNIDNLRAAYDGRH